MQGLKRTATLRVADPKNSQITLSGLQALAELEYPDKLQKLLLTPQREVLVELVVTKDNGEVLVSHPPRWTLCAAARPRLHF